MTPVKLGIIGLGNMARGHLKNIDGGEVPGVTVAALCDRDPTRLDPLREREVPCFKDSAELIRSGAVEAVLIATPHYDHTTIGIDALGQGLHVMVEKPISVHRADCERLIAAYQSRPDPEQVFAAMFNQRTTPAYRKVRQLIRGGELGALRRVNWIITNWFRTEAYYRSGGWRATWQGEGGGVLLNQCPHQLDLLWWLCGAPETVHAHCRFGQWHDIEVEDDVTAYLRWPNGASGVFVTTTGEAPGTNRLEIVGERGKLVVEDMKLHFTRNEVEMTAHSRTTDQGFGKPPVWHIDIPAEGPGGQHREVLQNFAEAIRGESALIAPAVEGIHSVELANAMLLSTWTDGPVSLPIDGADYQRRLEARWPGSRYEVKMKEATGSGPAADFAKSF